MHNYGSVVNPNHRILYLPLVCTHVPIFHYPYHSPERVEHEQRQRGYREVRDNQEHHDHRSRVLDDPRKEQPHPSTGAERDEGGHVNQHGDHDPDEDGGVGYLLVRQGEAQGGVPYGEDPSSADEKPKVDGVHQEEEADGEDQAVDEAHQAEAPPQCESISADVVVVEVLGRLEVVVSHHGCFP